MIAPNICEIIDARQINMFISFSIILKPFDNAFVRKGAGAPQMYHDDKVFEVQSLAKGYVSLSLESSLAL
jgi:hypothetical protein